MRKSFSPDFMEKAALAATKGEMTTSELSRNTRFTGHK